MNNSKFIDSQSQTPPNTSGPTKTPVISAPINTSPPTLDKKTHDVDETVNKYQTATQYFQRYSSFKSIERLGKTKELELDKAEVGIEKEIYKSLGLNHAKEQQKIKEFEKDQQNQDDGKTNNKGMMNSKQTTAHNQHISANLLHQRGRQGGIKQAGKFAKNIKKFIKAHPELKRDKGALKKLKTSIAKFKTSVNNPKKALAPKGIIKTERRIVNNVNKQERRVVKTGSKSTISSTSSISSPRPTPPRFVPPPGKSISNTSRGAIR